MGYIRARASTLGNDIITECHLSTRGSRRGCEMTLRKTLLVANSTVVCLRGGWQPKMISSGRNVEDDNIYEE